MKIVVIGCGKIGCTVIESLLAEGHEIAAMDNDPEVLSEITNIYDVFALCGSGTDSDALIEAQVAKSELVIAVTGSDEFNMLSCFIARRLGAKHTIARIRKPEYNDKSLEFLKKELHLSMVINPESFVARELFNVLKLPSAVKVETFSRGSLEMIELKLKENSPLDGLSLSELKHKHPDNFLICAVERDGELYIPDGNFVLKSGDKIGLTASFTEIQRLLKKLTLLQRQARNVMILGATRTSYYLARMLIAGGNSVKIIDSDIKRCKEFSELLPEAVIINGDAAKQELLLEEGIKSVDALFETVSGFTTTGASILNDVEVLSHGILFWRSFTHWIGGMGIIVFVMAILPNVSERPIHILRAEVPGPIKGKLVPRIKDTAVILYLIYIVLTVLETVLLLLGGMPLFESVVHTFGTAGTGGFGVKSDSIGGYSPYIQWVITVFMLIFAINFNLYYLILMRNIKAVIKSGELWCFLGVVAASVAVITFNIRFMFEGFSDSLRAAAFQVASIISTTGYVTADYNSWPRLRGGRPHGKFCRLFKFLKACAFPCYAIRQA